MNPDSAKPYADITLYDYKTEELIKHPFLLSDNDDFKLFAVPSELRHLDGGNLHTDGTFKAVKKLPFSQVYIISVKLGLLNEILVYPIIYCVMKHAREVLYEKF